VFIQPWDAAADAAEWREWLAGTDRFGTLVVNNVDPARAPLALPAHFGLAEDGAELLMHLARPNPVWPHLEAAAEVRLAVTGDYAYIPGYWRARADAPETHGVPTSYYAAVQFVCRPTVIDDPAAKAAILTAQMADLQPEGRHADIAVDDGPYARMLPGIRGIRLEVLSVEAKFKFDDQKPVELREEVSHELDRRGQGLDGGAAAQQRRRVGTVGDWQSRRDLS
jgi:transcriptional regulator